LEYFKKHQKIIFRSIGALLLVIGFVVNFWTRPQEAVSLNSVAAANVARMEASVAGVAPQSVKKVNPAHHISKALKATREKQMRYLTIFAMIIGGLFLLYSFLKKDDA